MIFILAHGGLGWWDEMIFGAIAIIFLSIMALSWVRSRNTRYEFKEPTTSQQDNTSNSDDYFKLD